MFESIVLVITCLLNLTLGFIVYIKNPRSITNRLFLGLTFSIVVWSVVNYLSVHPVGLSQLVWARLVLFFAAFLCLMIYLTFSVFPVPTSDNLKRNHLIAISCTIAVMALTLTPLVFRRLVAHNGEISARPGVAIPLFVVLIITLLTGGIGSLIKKYRQAKGISRDQLKFVLIGLSGAFGLIFITNLLLVIAFNNLSLLPYGPSFILIFISSMAYAIVRHRLFDIRLAATRGLAYIMTLVILAGIYALTVIGVSSFFLKQQNITNRAQAINTIVALALALSFQPIKHYFDRFSNNIFYRNAYNPQQLLEELNRVFVLQVSVNNLIKSTVAILEHNIKSQGCAFVINSTTYMPTRLVSTANSSCDLTLITMIDGSINKLKQKVTVAEYLDGNYLQAGSELASANIAVVIRLLPQTSRHSTSIGEILLGPKKDGSTYTKQDIEILEIVADELVVTMQNALRFEEIGNFNITLQEKVNEATRKLRRTNEKLKQMDETKDDFISMASHQLRTPLTSVKGYISMVLEEDAGKITPTQREMLGQAFFSSQRMVYLIADLLNVSRLKTGKFIIERAPVQLDQVVQQELRQLQETAAARSLTLQYDQPASFPVMMLDETKTRQIIMNFIDNAIYYTPAGGHIIVRLVEKDRSIELRVEDDGIGVPKLEQQHLFTKFYRAGNARQARPDGTGLGLYMAKKVIVAQGGSLLFESVEGKGSTFGFIFSKSLVANDEPQLPIADIPVQPGTQIDHTLAKHNVHSIK